MNAYVRNFKNFGNRKYLLSGILPDGSLFGIIYSNANLKILEKSPCITNEITVFSKLFDCVFSFKKNDGPLKIKIKLSLSFGTNLKSNNS